MRVPPSASIVDWLDTLSSAVPSTVMFPAVMVMFLTPLALSTTLLAAARSRLPPSTLMSVLR